MKRVKRFVVVGAGAVGGLVGARLFESGKDVLLVARGAHGRAIADSGLRVESPAGTVVLKVPVVASASDVDWQPGDCMMLAVKSQDTYGLLAGLAGSVPSETPLVCLQNGVENERLALRFFENVYGSCVYCPATHLDPGVVEANSAPVTGIVDIGRYPAHVDETVTELVDALSGATFASMARTDIMAWKYRKLLSNLSNASEVLFGSAARFGPVTAAAMEEGERCLAQAGITCVTVGEDAERRDGLLTDVPLRGREDRHFSTWQSIERGTGAVETDYLTGEIVLLGRLTGTPTPVNSLVLDWVHELVRAGDPPGSRDEEAFWVKLSQGD